MRALEKIVKSTAMICVIFMADASSASASECEQISSYEGDGSSSIARALITYVERYWDIATKEKPDKLSVSLVDDPSGDGSKIDFYNAQFKSFQAGFYRYPDGTPMPSELATMSANFKLPCGLKVGQSEVKVKAILGSPTYVQQRDFVYATGGDQNGEVIFTFKRGKLTRVAWEYDTH